MLLRRDFSGNPRRQHYDRFLQENAVILQAVPLELDTPFAELFSRCAQEPGALFLDSCDHPQAQFDFIFRQPHQWLTESTDWPQRLHAELALLPPYQGPAHIPFQGGIAGAFSYDAGRALERLPERAAIDIELPDIAIGVYHQALIRCRQTQQTWLVAPQTQLAELKRFWLEPKSPQSAAFQLCSDWRSNMSLADYTEKFERIQDYLQAGDCYQINLAQRFSADFKGDAWNAYQRLRDTNRAPFSGFLRLSDGAVLSVSPERFLRIDADGHVQTKPIKGTKPRSADATEDAALAEALAQSAKDRAENVMIVDLLRNDLSRLCEPGSVQVPTLFAIESYPAVHHLVSTVTGTLSDAKLGIELLGMAFPGGSITGAPKIRAMEIIEELEPHRRSFYCGSLGYFSQHGLADTNIAIRTLVASANRIHCWAGGGIVADSEAMSEYQETLDKVAKILPVLQYQPKPTDDEAHHASS
ncbi:aminodeoxychorismate synthase, component I [Pseudidiomarina aestuarii]|uniref:aminodeoxychorismate synthase n=2 Tax=Pseudidiomarina aestuarii TaxID=624146 RepID=A0A7Z7ET73_9GAMM|nr:aminodeoxychorismate synthase, component I [Pseudidiomarina aestuarii]